MSIFLDFDGTITAEDSIGELVDFALDFQRQQQEPQQHGDPGVGAEAGERVGRDLRPQWAYILRAYTSEYRSFTTSYHPLAPSRLSLPEEITFLRSLKDIETRSLARIRDYALFRGISAAEFRNAGAESVRTGRVRLRNGFGKFVRERVAEGWKVYVVSVNWSGAFIEGACGVGLGEGEGKGEGFTVLANEVRESDGAVMGPEILNPGGEGVGEMRNMTNSYDKLEVVKAILRRQEEKENQGSGKAKGKERPTFYFGDSTTDLECLLAASKGIVMEDDEVESSPLLETLRRLGRDVPHVTAGSAGLARAGDFDEVMEHVKFELE